MARRRLRHSPAGCVDAVGGLQQWPAAAAAGHCIVICTAGGPPGLSHVCQLPRPSRLCFHLCLSVCLFVNKTTQELLIKSLQNVMEWLNIIQRTNRLNFEWSWPKVEGTRGHKVKIVFANNSVRNCHSESQQKLKCSLFDSLNISKYDCDVGLTVSKLDRGQTSEWSGCNEIYNSLKLQWLNALLNLNVY